MKVRAILRPLPLLRDERGVSVIELGFLAPILAFLLLGTTDLARGYSRKMIVESAVHRALEKAAVGSVQSDYTFLKTEVVNAVPGLAASRVTVETYLMCDTTKMPSFAGACGFRANGTAEEISRYVKLRVADRWEPLFNYGIGDIQLFGTGSDGMVPITVETSLRVQ